MGYAALLERTGNVDEAGNLKNKHSREMDTGNKLYNLQIEHSRGQAITLRGYPAQAEEIFFKVPHRASQQTCPGV